LAVGALPAELDAEWAAYASRVAGARERALVARQSDALARLLEGDGREPGLVKLLAERNVEPARSAVAAAAGLSPRDAAAWRGAVEDLADALAAARAALARQAGGDVELRLRGGVGVRGRLLADATNAASTSARAPASRSTSSTSRRSSRCCLRRATASRGARRCATSSATASSTRRSTRRSRSSRATR
jgi:hypothetical protein